MENAARTEKQPQERNLSLCAEQQARAPDPRLCRSAIKIRPCSEEFFPIIINVEEEIRLLKEEKKRASDEAKSKQFLCESITEDTPPEQPSDDDYSPVNESSLLDSSFIEDDECSSTNETPTPVYKPAFAPTRCKENIKPKPNVMEPELGVTPLRPEPKIQCSIDVSSYMRTPLNHAAPIKMRPVSTARRSNEDQSGGCSPMMRVLFRKIRINNVNYIVLKELGKGGSSCVYHCFDPKTEVEYAVKCVDLNQDQNAVTGYINEVKTLHKLQHCKRVIKMYTYQILKDEKKLYVVLEKGGEDLSTILKERTPSSERLSLYMIVFYWMEMLHAVKEIHTNGVIHSDLKPANFLEAGGKIKLIDFGIASCVQQDNTSVVKNVALGTFSYISPEALRGDKSDNFDSPNYGKRKFRISYKSDVWSLGCILYQLVYKRTPFQHLTHVWAKLSTIMDPNHQIEYPPISNVPEDLLRTIKDCLQYDMKSRPSIDDLISKYGQYYC